MTQIELENMRIETEHGIFTPTYEYEDFDIVTQTYENFKIVKTADEVYQEYLENKDKPVEPQLTVEEEIKALKEENSILQSCILELANMIGNK